MGVEDAFLEIIHADASKLVRLRHLGVVHIWGFGECGQGAYGAQGNGRNPFLLVTLNFSGTSFGCISREDQFGLFGAWENWNSIDDIARGLVFFVLMVKFKRWKSFLC